MDKDDIIQIAMRLALQKEGELRYLVDLVEALRPKRVLEIGTARGGTLFCWCRLADPEATLVSIDLPGGQFGGGSTQEYAQLMQKEFPLPNQTLHLMRRDSHKKTTLQDAQNALDGEVDFLMIDGDHTYEGVKRDFEMYSPLVRKGGAIAFHDIVEHPDFPTCKVDQFWNEIKNDYQHDEFVVEPKTWGGIGILNKA